MTIYELIQRSSLYDEKKKIVLYRGVDHPTILFIGEAPGKEENEVGVPFVGRSGKLVQKWIDQFHIGHLTGITNSVPLMPTTVAGTIRKPSLEEIDYFRPFVHTMIKNHQPRIIILLGDTATTSVLRTPISQTRGKVHYKHNAFVTAMYHPAYYLRHGQDGIADFQKIYDDVLTKQIITL